jgi:hypothetical protein
MAALSSAGLAQRLTGGRILRFVVLLLLSVALTAVSVIDADGDPATTNLPPVTLVSEIAQDPEQIKCSSSSLDSGDPSGARAFALLRVRISTILSHTRFRFHTRARPLRGP